MLSGWTQQQNGGDRKKLVNWKKTIKITQSEQQGNACQNIS